MQLLLDVSCACILQQTSRAHNLYGCEVSFRNYSTLIVDRGHTLHNIAGYVLLWLPCAPPQYDTVEDVLQEPFDDGKTVMRREHRNGDDRLKDKGERAISRGSCSDITFFKLFSDFNRLFV